MDGIAPFSNKFSQRPQNGMTLGEYKAYAQLNLKIAFNCPPDEAETTYNRLISGARELTFRYRPAVDDGDDPYFQLVLIARELSRHDPGYDEPAHQFLTILFEKARMWLSDEGNKEIAKYIFSAIGAIGESWKVNIYFIGKIYCEIHPTFSMALACFRHLAGQGYVPPLQHDAAIIKDPYSYIYQENTKYCVFKDVLDYELSGPLRNLPKDLPLPEFEMDEDTFYGVRIFERAFLKDQNCTQLVYNVSFRNSHWAAAILTGLWLAERCEEYEARPSYSLLSSFNPVNWGIFNTNPINSTYYYRKILELDPNQPEAKFKYTQALAKKGDPDALYQLAKCYLNIEPNNYLQQINNKKVSSLLALDKQQALHLEIHTENARHGKQLLAMAAEAGHKAAADMIADLTEPPKGIKPVAKVMIENVSG